MDGAVAAKRRVLIDALMMCLGRSRVVNVVDARTVRGVLDSAAGELWREGEFRLEPVWKLLVAQPELTAADVAPPLLAFKAFESELGVQVRVPQALSAIPRGDQVKLRDELGLQQEDFAKAIEEMRELAAEDQRAADQAKIVERAARTLELSPVPPPTARKKPKLAALIGLGVVAAAAASGGVWVALRDTSESFDVSDVAGTLALGSARRAQASLSAVITDPRWDTLSKDEQKKLAGQLLTEEEPKGIKMITLSDEKGATRAIASEGPNGQIVVVP